MRVLTLNAGSRSHNLDVYEVPERPPLEPPEPVWHAEVEASDDGFAHLLRGYDGDAPAVAAHRVVHPGPTLATARAARMDAAVRAAIEAATPLAPGHNPLALEGIDAVTERFGDETANVAVFDTLLGDDAPPAATTYAVPGDWRDRYGLRRYGFHGISQRDVLDRIDALIGAQPGRRTISVHLGSGCSVSAFAGRRAVDTTMGMTPLEGLAMGARSGSVDPGAIFALLRAGMKPDDLERDLRKASGLLALSGNISSDTRDVIAARDRGDERAAFALSYYAYRIREHIGMLAASAGGIDVLSFTGPVGEHMPELRADACEGLGFMGVELDAARNDAINEKSQTAEHRVDAEIGRHGARVRVCVIRTLEEWAMARIAAALLRSA